MVVRDSLYRRFGWVGSNFNENIMQSYKLKKKRLISVVLRELFNTFDTIQFSSIIMICIENLLIINRLDHLFIIFYRLCIVPLFISSHNESCCFNQMKNLLRHFFLSLYHVMYKSKRNFGIVHMSFEVSGTTDEEVTDDEMNSQF